MDELTKLDDAIEKGIEKGRIEVARNMFKRNRPIDEIAEDTGLSFDEIKKLAH